MMLLWPLIEVYLSERSEIGRIASVAKRGRCSRDKCSERSEPEDAAITINNTSPSLSQSNK